MGLTESIPDKETARWAKYVEEIPDWDPQDAKEVFTENLDYLVKSMSGDFLRDYPEWNFENWLRDIQIAGLSPEEKHYLAKNYATDLTFNLVKEDPTTYEFPLFEEFSDKTIKFHTNRAMAHMNQ